MAFRSEQVLMKIRRASPRSHNCFSFLSEEVFNRVFEIAYRSFLFIVCSSENPIRLLGVVTWVP